MSILAEGFKRIPAGAGDMEIVEFEVDGEPVYLTGSSLEGDGRGRVTVRFTSVRPVWQG